ncbi:hypothetical protein Hamer_G001690, partial [Homarus americanus]
IITYLKAMSKIYKMGDLQQPSPSVATETDWDKCVLCQKLSGEAFVQHNQNTTQEEQDLQDHKEGRDVSLVFDEDVGPALRKACDHDAENDRCREGNSSTLRHGQKRETPVPVYLGLLIHTKTHKKELVDVPFKLRFCISYNRVLGISIHLGNDICRYFEMEKAVCPPNLKGGFLTTAAIDNIDHNPSSTTAQGCFHGTGISLFQHPSVERTGFQRITPASTESNHSTFKQGLAKQPQSYTNVPPVTLCKKDPLLPKLWLEHVRQVVTMDNTDEDENISWAIYHSSHRQLGEIPHSNISNPTTLQRWMVSSPDLAHVIEEFQDSMEKRKKKADHRHNEQTKSIQMKYFTHVKALSNVIEEMENPFIDNSCDLLILDTRDLADPAVVDTVRKTVRYNKDPIKRNNLPLFSRLPVREKSRAKHQLSSVKSDCSLFSSLYISCQIRDGDLDEFFTHENQACPPSLSSMGKLRLGTKSDLVYCLEELIPPTTRDSTPAAEPEPSVDKIDSSTADAPGTSCTFSECSTQIFLPYINSQLQYANRVDLVWDEYIPGSLKIYTSSNRGKGSRRQLESSNALPRNFRNAAKHGYFKVMIRTVDTAVLVLAISAFHLLNITEL